MSFKTKKILMYMALKVVLSFCELLEAVFLGCSGMNNPTQDVGLVYCLIGIYLQVIIFSIILVLGKLFLWLDDNSVIVSKTVAEEQMR